MDAKVFRANGTIRRARFVKIDSSDNNSVLEADANERVIGIAQLGGREAPIPSVTADPPEASNSGDDVQVFLDGQYTLVEAGGTFSSGDLLKSNADGEAVVIDETAGNKEEVGAIALAAGADGELVPVIVRCQTVTTET